MDSFKQFYLLLTNIFASLDWKNNFKLDKISQTMLQFLRYG